MSASQAPDYAALYRVLAESTPDAIITIDERSVLQSVNPAGERLFGYSAADLVGSPLTRLMPERMRAPHAEGIARYLATGRRNIPWSALRLPILTRDGREVPAEISFGEFVADGRRMFSGIVRDVSDRLAAETRFVEVHEQLQGQALELEQQMEEAQTLSEELERSNEELLASGAGAVHALQEARASEARYRALVEAGSGMVWRADAAGRTMRAASWTTLTGRSNDDADWMAAIHPDDRARAGELWAMAFASHSPYEMDYRLQMNDGEYRWYHVRGVPVFHDDGAVMEWIGNYTPVDLGPLRARRLLALAAGLSEEATPDAVAEVIFVEGLAALGAEAGSLATVHEADGVAAGFEIVRFSGYAEDVVRRYQRSPLNPGRPLTEAILTRRPVLVPSATDLQARFPDAAAEMIAMGYPAFAVVPVVHGDHVLAALNFSFRRPQAFDEGSRTYLETVGQLCAQALVRARLFESEREARARSETIVRAIRDGFAAMDSNLRYTYVNPAAEAMLARDAAEMLGRTPWEVAPGTEDSPFVQAYRASLADQRPRTVELQSVMTGTWLEVHVHPAPGSLTLIFQDVTERRQNRRDAEFLSEAGRVLGSSLDYEATLETLVLTVVPELADWCVVDLVDLMEEAPAIAWPPVTHRIALRHADPSRTNVGLELGRRFPPTWEEGELMTRVIKYGETGFVPKVTDEMIMVTARNAEHLELMRQFAIASVLIVPLQARGRILGAMTLCMTDSGRRFSERDRALAEELGRRAGFAVDNARLYRAAMQARVEAERANKAKSDLLAKVSHETRQPVHATIGWTDTLDLGIYGPITAEQGDALRRIKQNQERLLSVLNDLLDMSRIEAGKLDLRLASVALDELLEAVEGAVLPQVRAKSLRYESSCQLAGLAVYADRDHLAGILTNLLSNAVKFTPAGGSITVSCRDGGADVVIDVADSGMGVAEALHERIFEPFFQVDSGFTRTTSGAGLGLAISREAARAMKGDIVVRSEPGLGSTFSLILPKSSAS